MAPNSPQFQSDGGQLKITHAIKLLFGIACVAGVLINYNHVINVIMEGAEAKTKSTDKLVITPQKESHNYIEELMYKYGSDKSRDDHSYTKFYNMIFASIRLSVTNITEIGISQGQSIQAWYRYFPHAEIHGFEKNTPRGVLRDNLDLLKHRVHTHIVDILKPNINMTDLGFVPESMDIIIDDGPHSVSSQEGFLQKLFPCLKPGGYYVIEDIGISGPGNGVAKFHDDPSKLQQATRDILEAHDTIWVDTAIGHREWEEWLKRSGRQWAINTTHHNSYMVVIQKRTDPLREPYQMNAKYTAMQEKGVVVEDGSDI